ncbi:MAG TPA: hypothetical protein VD926_01025, partial [Acidimicrobiales bacterium]|nr:hypothetical protein [Acidimicrobiales bacterium]
MRAPLYRRLSRSSARTRQLWQRIDLTQELGVRLAFAHRADKVASRRWAPAARLALYREIWGDAADEIGAAHEHLGDGYVRFTLGEARSTVWFHNTQLDDPVTLRLALDKVMVHGLLRDAGIPVPEHRQFTPGDPEPGLELLRQAGGAFVVKPASGTSGGTGVTCAVDSERDFHRAGLHAARLGERLLIERHLVGEEFRFLFLDGELLDVIRRRAPHVTGDGTSTVAELVSAENHRREAGGGHDGISVLELDLDSVLTLDQAGLAVDSVVPAGTAVAVKSAANSNAPADNDTVDLVEIDETVVDQARAAASILGLRFAGVDLITPDVSRPFAEVGGAIVEVNGTPGLSYHYLVSDP